MKLEIQVYQDGDNEPFGLQQILDGWNRAWNAEYILQAELKINTKTINLKQSIVHSNLPESLREIIKIRNPDLYFVETSRRIELGGVEITSHSPDGSNVEKRYPYLWISRKNNINAFIASPYSKVRPGGEINRLPHRHANHNLQFLDFWQPLQNQESSIQQIVPIYELQGGTVSCLPKTIQDNLLKWDDVGAFFAHTLAVKTLGEDQARVAKQNLNEVRKKLIELAVACKNNTSHTDASSLLMFPDRWIQIYNARPDSGHWERGEGQFDSIDGRLMFTLDEIELLESADKPDVFEFWLPQLASGHAWVREQRERGYGSKRFRNVCIVFQDYGITKFADDLTEDDWRILEENSGSLLERLDWRPNVYKISNLVSPSLRLSVARDGLKNPRKEQTEQILELLNDENLFFSAHRAYVRGWRNSFEEDISILPINSRVLVPRIPGNLLLPILSRSHCLIVSAEECTKEELLMLRQIHRWTGKTTSSIERYTN